MAPLYAHAYDQLERLHSRRTISYWYGARALKDIYYADEMEELTRKHANFSWQVALSDPEPEDNWSGARGFIHEVIFDQYLGNHPGFRSHGPYQCLQGFYSPGFLYKADYRIDKDHGKNDTGIHPLT